MIDHSNDQIWEQEYRNPKLITLGTEAIQSVKDWVRFLRREKQCEFTGIKILDLGCGNGKNSIYIAQQGEHNEIYGIDISKTAIMYAQKLSKDTSTPDTHFTYGTIGKTLPFIDAYFDIVLDVTSSNSLNEKERESYLQETARVLKPSGHFFLRALCKDGDTNAKNLIKSNPSKEKDTYTMPELRLTERVFTKQDLLDVYTPHFHIVTMKKETHYTKFNHRSYKRNFWVVYLDKKDNHHKNKLAGGY